jgi:hypothetical protein
MNEEKKRPEAEEKAQNEGEATATKRAPDNNPPKEDDVEGYGEPPDASGGGK